MFTFFYFMLETSFLVSEGKQSMIIVSATLQEFRNILLKTPVLESVCFKMKSQACNFPENIAKLLTPLVAASEKSINFSEKHHWRRRNKFTFLTNTTE